MPLSHLDWTYHYWQRLLKPGDAAIDATCGNGKDTLRLARHLKLGAKNSLDALSAHLHLRPEIEKKPSPSYSAKQTPT